MQATFRPWVSTGPDTFCKVIRHHDAALANVYDVKLRSAFFFVAAGNARLPVSLNQRKAAVGTAHQSDFFLLPSAQLRPISGHFFFLHGVRFSRRNKARFLRVSPSIPNCRTHSIIINVFVNLEEKVAEKRLA
ncbi:MAG: hypothetical protein Q7J11_00615 [Candidatus Roizmanbacteria bacterium]|nr:hypothetical protein [Candidatus Roizmanbacteria bacterium]